MSNTYSLDSELSGGWRYPTFEQSRPETFSITGILVEEKINASKQATKRLVFACMVSFFLATQIQPQKYS